MSKELYTTTADGEHERAYAYLLGEMDDAEQFRFERDYLADAEAYAAYLAAQDELIEDYLGGGLAPARRERFATNFLVTEERRERLRLIRDLNEHAQSLSAGEGVPRFGAARASAPLREPSAPLASRLRALLGWPRERFTFAPRALATAAVLALLCFVGWRLMLERSDESTERAGVAPYAPQNQSDAVPTTTPPDAIDPSAPLVERQKPSPPEMVVSPRRRPARVSYALTLSPISLRDTSGGETHTLRLPRSADGPLNLRLLLDDADEVTTVGAQVNTAEGVHVYASRGLRVRRRQAASFVNLKLSTASLADGDYTIKLTGTTTGGEPSVLARYSLSVMRR